MENVGYAALGIIPSFKGFGSQLERGVSGPMGKAGATGGLAFGDEAGKTAGRRFGGVFSTVAKASLVGVFGAGALATKVVADSIGLASDLNESLNAVNVTYGKQSEAVQKLGKDAADSLGLSNAEFNGLAVQFSAFASQVAQGSGRQVVGVLDELTTRGADFASVMNLEVNEAMGLFQSGLAGETEPLRKFGIDLSAAAVEAHALETGITSGKRAMTESEKVQARYSLLMQQTAKTSGDFANTSDSLANRQRILNARWDDARAKLGTALLPAMEDLVGVVLDKGIPAFERFSDWFVESGIPALKQAAEFGADTAAVIGDIVGFLNKMPSEAKIAALGAALGGGALLKMRGGGAGLAGAAGSALGLAKPVPVFVTNPGFGGGTGVVPGAAGGKASSALKTGAKALPILGAVAVGYELGGDEFGGGGAPAGAGILGLGNIQNLKQRVDEGADYMTSGARRALNDTAEAFRNADIPDEMKTKIALTGVPQSMNQAQALVKQYNLTPKEKRTLFQLLGYDTARRQILQINRDLDWAARPREARISITRSYAAAGYETRGGLQAGGGGPVQRTIDADRRFNRGLSDRD